MFTQRHETDCKPGPRVHLVVTALMEPGPYLDGKELKTEFGHLNGKRGLLCVAGPVGVAG